MSTIKTSNFGPLTGNTASVVDPTTPINGIARLTPLVNFASASLTGTYVTFTNIPSWARRVTVVISYLQNNSSTDKAIQLGTASGFVTSGYAGGNAYSGGSNAGGIWGGGGISLPTGSTPDVMHGAITMYLITGNTWVISGVGAYSSSTNTWQLGGSIALSGALTQLRIGSVGGTATWTQGTANVFYE